MTVIWTEEASGWQILHPSGFPNEAQLHELIATAPEVLPLAGNPKLVVLGTEVQLASGRADIVAVETTGRPVVIEVKLSTNPESRRAVVAQVLSYASNIYQNSVDEFANTLSTSLGNAGHGSLTSAVEAAVGDASVDPVTFTDSLRESMESGDIRLVLVLDSAPNELVGLVGYLGAIAPNLTLDLVTVTAFQIGDQRVIVPQRVEPARVEAPKSTLKQASPSTGQGTAYSQGSAEFAAGIEAADPEYQEELRRYLAWAEALADDGLATLRTGRGPTRWTLQPIVKGGDAGLVTIWNDRLPAISPWRTAFDKWAPATLAKLDAMEPPVPILKGNNLHAVSDDVLDLFAEAYSEAATSGLALPELDTPTRAILIKLGPWQQGTDLDTGRRGHGYRPGMTRDEIYESVRSWWILDPKRAETYEYVIAVHQGVTLAMWNVVPGSWTSREIPGESRRWAFEGTEALPEIVQEFIGDKGKRIPRFRPDGRHVFGSGSPIGYWPS
jgi:hypothetical protein